MRILKFLLLIVISFYAFASFVCADECGLPKPDQVIIYTDKDRGGLCRVLGPGQYLEASSFGLPDNSISSIDVGSKTRAVLYAGANLKGRQAHFEGGWNYSSIGNVNDKTSSIWIFPMQGGQASTHYLGNYPIRRKNYWSEQAQGLANDGKHWFIARKGKIFKIPLSVDLNDKDISPSIIYTEIPPELDRLGYNHFGDPDQNSGFVFVPVESDDARSRPYIAVFSAVDLRFLSSVELADSGARSGPWVAIRPREKTLWVSSNTLSGDSWIREYTIDWEALNTHHHLNLTFRRQVRLFEPVSGSVPYYEIYQDMPLSSLQGGVFNPEGTLLYLSTGPCDARGYIYVFAIGDTREGIGGYMQARSESAYGFFNFENHPETTLGYCSRDEGEGIDWLDARGLNIPGIPDGQLHLIMIDNDLGTDKIYLKHYSF